ncbi:hypothetical protein PK34_21345 [Stutzerimonas stutzeri]|jgi:hypothetical protein|uniref:hypothetical protein n=1 Tax=Stutzerimonas stutzeri subgroup TaxID=578833 RepID=UPI000627C95D|nr:hypothetical protein [Stutzerimonas kunmingensis]KKJ93356.1 hypothetical protein PK34_21345 [Stutzerimonas stutzeri]MAF87094.1 hypothetical protein [Pseudomonas sp.]MBD3876977.1 hypothetical protein [Stutzerimonas kunmingensis]HAG79166.1 hypothetical protein [Pseudomonas sp.]HCH76105.1 hypothetical protein [Pseudomonas sp.]|tara:strand:- start:904 stop:1578 length:675 start_codon:yes stop_codon:yes gene_type:complete
MFTEIKIELSKFDWSGVSGLSDVVMVLLTLVLLAGLKQGAKNIRESSISRDADILRWAMSEMDTLKPQIRLLTDAHKRHNYCGLPHDPETNPNGWTSQELDAAQVVGVNLQRIGYMALHNLVSRNHFMNIWGPMYLACWYALEPWVKHKRKALNEPVEIKDGAYSRIYFEQYAHYCETHLPRRLVDNERQRFGLQPLQESKLTFRQRLLERMGKNEVLDVRRDR